MSSSEPKPKVFYKHIKDILSAKPSSPQSYIRKRQERNPLSEVKNKPRDLSASSSKKKLRFIEKIKTETNQEQLNSVSLYSTYYNKVDAIFTDLEDYLCHAKENTLEQVRKLLKKGANHEVRDMMEEKVEDVNKMADYIKHISNYLVYNEVPKRAETQPTQEINSKTRKQKQNKMYTESNESCMFNLSTQNSRARANRRADMITNRKKTVYQTILQQSQVKHKNSTKRK